MDRRTFAKYVAGYIAATAVCSRCFAQESGGWPAQGVIGNSEKGDKVDASYFDGLSWPEPGKQAKQFLKKKIGCTLSASESSQFQESIPVLKSCGDKTIDQMMYFETNVLRDYIGVSPDFGFFNDGDSPNAFATSERLLGRGQGTVLFGRGLLWDQIKKRGRHINQWGTAIVGVMIHEWAHIRQFSDGIDIPGKPMELHADFMAGWLLAIKASSGKQFNIKTLARSLYEIGDHNYSSPHHHGTPEERVDAMWSGWQQVFKHRNVNSTSAYRAGLKYAKII